MSTTEILKAHAPEFVALDELINYILQHGGRCINSSDVRALLDAFAQTKEENARMKEALEWRPIETAPRDGTPFLAIKKYDKWPFWSTADVVFIEVVPEDEDDINVLEGGMNRCAYTGRSAGEYFGTLCELSGMDEQATYKLPITDYTHWQPLPKPPGQKEEV